MPAHSIVLYATGKCPYCDAARAALDDPAEWPAFGRPLDYYTGLVFEVTVREDHRVLAGGGRFALDAKLGAKA